MASTGKKHKVKGKTFNLNDFLGSEQDAPSGYAVVNTSRRLNWADTMENEAIDDPVLTEKYTIDYKKDERIILPTAPKAARGPDVDLARVPNKPPYTVYLGNLPYDITDDDVTKFFRKLKVSSVRLPRESGERSRMRGFGYAEFPDRSTLLEALAFNNESLKGRSIKVSLAEEHADNEGRDRGNRDRDFGRSERALGDWRAAPRDEPDEGRRPDSYGGSRGGFEDSDRYRRSGFDRDGGDRDRDFGYGRDRDGRDSYSRGPSRGFGGDRDGFDRDRRGGGGSSSFERRDDRGFGRSGSYGGFRDEPREKYQESDRDERDRGQESGPRERKKLQLKPRSTEAPKQAPPPAKAAAAIFGGARPVDTAAREREIEERLAKQREEEERRQVREPFMERKEERVRRSSVGSGSGRSRRSSESSSRENYDDVKLSRQLSNESDQQSAVRAPPHDQPPPSKADRTRRPEQANLRESYSSRNGERVQKSGTAADDDKEVVYTSKNIYAHLEPEEEAGNVSN
ncbi:eukaryotic translation initiation factor 4B-like isoform X1 [Ornithodoros turicata]|uniref:eukaryotic translation initiation factor 4B-like isoform X1 n=1 Tax=Ornithodoros turicata TaxID=34597 RepID=UPI003138C62D